MSQESSQTAVSSFPKIQSERQPPPPTSQQTFDNDGDLVEVLCPGNDETGFVEHFSRVKSSRDSKT